jgi:hypothetical protein
MGSRSGLVSGEGDQQHLEEVRAVVVGALGGRGGRGGGGPRRMGR